VTGGCSHDLRLMKGDINSCFVLFKSLTWVFLMPVLHYSNIPSLHLEILVNFPWALSMDDTMASTKVTNENQLVSLALLKSWTINLRDINTSSISVFTFVGCGSGFCVPSCGCVGFWLCLSSILIILLQLNKGVYIN